MAHHHVLGGYHGRHARASWINPDDVEVTEEMRATALARANETLGKLDELRKRRELPIEMLPLIAMEYGSALRDLITVEARKAEAAEVAKYEAEIAQRPRHGGHVHNFAPSKGFDVVGGLGALAHAQRPGHGAGLFGAGDEVLFKSARPVKPTTPDPDEYRATRVISRPKAVAFRGEQVRITSPNPHDWVIVDILIGGRSQFAQAGELPGDVFAMSAFDSLLSFETCQTAMDIEFRVRYVGDNPEGEVFEAKMIGTFAR